ncbi:MAG: type II secretion system F family protein [Nitrospirae bacterium]|nr:MAG: type II secretion system F family protein [Nitrospirota bacterium]
MPIFTFVAIDHTGKERTGRLEAPDPKAAAATLKQQALFVLELRSRSGPVSADADAASELSAHEPQSDGSSSLLQRDLGEILPGLVALLRPIRTRDRIFFLQQTALMLRSGLTLIQSLETCRQQTTNSSLKHMLGRVARAVRSGKSFSQAVAAEKRLLPPLAVRLLEAAEASGELDTVLDKLAAHFEQKLALRTTLLTGLIYPAIVVLVSVGVATFLVVKVIPTFARFFSTRNTSLPASTQMLLDLSLFVTTYGVYIVLVLALVTIGLGFAYATPQGRLVLDRAILWIPVVGKLLLAGAMAQFSFTLAMLLNAGVTLLDSLRVVRHVIGNAAISHRLHLAAEAVLAGRDFSKSLEAAVIPPLVAHVVAVGERTGALAHVLDELGKFYERELQFRIKRMTTLVEPVLILIIGGMVGFVYFAFFQAVFQIATAGR